MYSKRAFSFLLPSMQGWKRDTKQGIVYSNCLRSRKVKNGHKLTAFIAIAGCGLWSHWHCCLFPLFPLTPETRTVLVPRTAARAKQSKGQINFVSPKENRRVKREGTYIFILFNWNNYGDKNSHLCLTFSDSFFFARSKKGCQSVASTFLPFFLEPIGIDRKKDPVQRRYVLQNGVCYLHIPYSPLPLFTSGVRKVIETLALLFW